MEEEERCKGVESNRENRPLQAILAFLPLLLLSDIFCRSRVVCYTNRAKTFWAAEVWP